MQALRCTEWALAAVVRGPRGSGASAAVVPGPRGSGASAAVVRGPQGSGASTAVVPGHRGSGVSAAVVLRLGAYPPTPARGLLPQPGIEPTSTTMEGRFFLTIGQLGKTLKPFLYIFMYVNVFNV